MTMYSEPSCSLPELKNLDETRVANDVHRPRFIEKALGVFVVFANSACITLTAARRPIV